MRTCKMLISYVKLDHTFYLINYGIGVIKIISRFFNLFVSCEETSFEFPIKISGYKCMQYLVTFGWGIGCGFIAFDGFHSTSLIPRLPQHQ